MGVPNNEIFGKCNSKLHCGALDRQLRTAKATSETESPPPLVGPSEELANLSGFAGTYVIVDARRASDVSAPAMPMIDVPIGETINFTRKGVGNGGRFL